jgi:hypothetical protein
MRRGKPAGDKEDYEKKKKPSFQTSHILLFNGHSWCFCSQKFYQISALTPREKSELFFNCPEWEKQESNHARLSLDGLLSSLLDCF